MRVLASTALALMTAISAMTVSTQDAEAHRYRGGAIAFGVASAVIAGIALSRYHRRYYYDDYPYYDDYYYAPRRYYSYGYYGPRVYGYGYYPRARAYAYGWGHRHYRGHHRGHPHAAHWRYGGRHWRRY